MHAYTFGHRLHSRDDLTLGAVVAEARCGVRYRVIAVEQDNPHASPVLTLEPIDNPRTPSGTPTRTVQRYRAATLIDWPEYVRVPPKLRELATEDWYTHYVAPEGILWDLP